MLSIVSIYHTFYYNLTWAMQLMLQPKSIFSIQYIQQKMET